MAFRAKISRLRTVIEDRLIFASNPFFRPVFPISDPARVDDAVRRISETAAFNVGPLVPREVCRSLSAAMGAAFDGSMPEVKVFTNPRTGVQQILNPGHLHPAVLEVATHPFLLSIVENYLRNRIFLADWDMRRVPPMSMAELDQRAHTGSVGYTSSHWHRDIRGHQVKVMIYLTDVTEKDNNFAFLPGTHKGFQTRPSRVEESRYSDEYVCNHPVNAVECYGPAGTTLVFDTNPIHRLRRKAGASVRDSITFYYTPGQELRELGLPANATSLMGPRVAALFGGERLSR